MVASAGAALSQAQRPSDNPAAPQNGATKEERGTKTRPFVVEIPSTEESRRQAHEQSEREDKAADRELSLVNWTKGLTAVTGLLVLFTGGLWLATRRLVADARKSSERELRAYIAVAPMGIAQLIGRTDSIGQVQLRNVGKLPAHRVFLSVHMAVTDDRDRTEFPVPPDDPMERAVQPGADMRQGSEDYIAVSKIIGGGGNVFVWGVVWYDDGYGERRFTRFCHRYSVSSHNRRIKWTVAPDKTRLILDADKARYHPSGNDSD